MHSVLLVLGISGLEMLIKKHREEHTEEKEYVNGHVHVMTYHNYGALLNSGEKRPWIVKWISILLTIGVSILFVLTLTGYGNRELRAGLAFLLGGAFSNTYDRIRKGFVTDYLNFPKLPGKLGRIVFNIADFCIMIGCCLILIKQNQD